MFPPKINGDVPISYFHDHPNKPLLDDHFEFFSNSKQDDPFSSFPHFPSSFLHHYELADDNNFYLQQHHHELLLYHQQPPSKPAPGNPPDTTKNNPPIVVEADKKAHNMSGSWQIQRKRSSKRDRHSKINTAQGPRDRRMRLSLEVAREFFDLQDMLGFDKPSRTVDWLLKQSKTAIEELARGLPQVNYSAKSAYSSTSECEVVSGTHENAIKGIVSKVNKPSKCVKKEKKMKQSRKPTYHPLAKDLREKARARARQRTREKMSSQKFEPNVQFEEARKQAVNVNQLGGGCCGDPNLEPGEESGSQSQNMNRSVDMVAEVHEEDPSFHEQESLGINNIQQDMVDESLVDISPSSIFNYLHNNGISHQEHQFGDFQFFGKPWESYNE